MLSFIDNVRIGTKSLVLFTLNVAPDVSVAAAGLSPPIAGLLNTSDILQCFVHEKSSSISHLTKDKSRDLKNTQIF